MLPATLLMKKRDGGTLTDDEIRFLVDGFCRGEVADYQMSAFAMAVCLRGMSPDEITSLKMAMLESGDRLPRVTDRPRVDKHSTGGLGDKVSLILAPLLACCDVDVPMISGRGLGLSGGTLDKLESIPGFEVQLSEGRAANLLKDIGTFIIGANEAIAPADRRLYGLRDVTGTVESVPLITASILSKKLAASLDALVMDVKVGSAAFMKTRDQATELAKSLIRVGGQAGMPTSALLTDMDQPLGAAVGNALEVIESIDVLQGDGPPEVRELTVELCADVLVQVQAHASIEDARVRLNRELDSGNAHERFARMVAAQGGSLKDPLKLAACHMIEAPQAGYLADIDCAALGEAVVALGGGRRKTGDPIDHRVGVRVMARVGQSVARGQPIAALHCDKADRDAFFQTIQDAVRVRAEPVAIPPLVIDRLVSGAATS
ncbi:MAG: thymidine phosphorylase [Planctomycetota bacterium]